MISIAFALALAAVPAPAPDSAGGCTLLNPAACRDAGALVHDSDFQAALRQFVGDRRTGFLTGAGRAYGETMTVLGGPAEPVRRLRNLYVFTACADPSCDDQASVVLQPDGELSAVAILHTDCGGQRRVGDCAARQVLSVLRRQDDDLSLIEALSAQARQDLAARPITPGAPIKVLDRVEVVVLDAPAQTVAAQSAPPRPAPIPIAPPQIAPLATAPKPAVQPAPAPAPRLAAAPPPRIVVPQPAPEAAPPPAPVPQARQAQPPPPQAGPPVLSEVTVDAAPIPVELQPLPRPPERLPLMRPPKVILVMVRPRDMEPSPPPPPPKPPRDGWQWHWTPADCRNPTASEGAIALGPVSVGVTAKACKVWKR